VFAESKPQLVKELGSNAHQDFDRAEEAARCSIHSNLLLAIYDELNVEPTPSAVFELAQHEVSHHLLTRQQTGRQFLVQQQQQQSP
jgi:hypothetical protein